MAREKSTLDPRARFDIHAVDFYCATRAMSLEDVGRLVMAACEAIAAKDLNFFNDSVPFFQRPKFFIGNPLYISPTVRRLVYDRDGRRCRRCSTTERLSVDHIHPRSKGGSDDLDNLQTLCMPCNRRKGVN